MSPDYFFLGKLSVMQFSVDKVTSFQNDVTYWPLFITVCFVLLCQIVLTMSCVLFLTVIITKKTIIILWRVSEKWYIQCGHSLSLSLSKVHLVMLSHSNNDNTDVTGGGAGKQMLASLSSRKVATSAWLLSPFQIKPARKCWTDTLNACRAPFVGLAIFEV